MVGGGSYGQFSGVHTSTTTADKSSLLMHCMGMVGVGVGGSEHLGQQSDWEQHYFEVDNIL